MPVYQPALQRVNKKCVASNFEYSVVAGFQQLLDGFSFPCFSFREKNREKNRVPYIVATDWGSSCNRLGVQLQQMGGQKIQLRQIGGYGIMRFFAGFN